MKNNDEFQRLHELLERYCDSALSLEETAELNGLLKDPQAKQAYLEFMDTHSRLARYLATSSSTPSNVSLLPVPDDASASNWQGWRFLSILSLAALLGLVLFAYWPKHRTETFVAKVVEKIDCDVEFSRWNPDSSKQLVAGQTLSVHRGLLSIEFGCGATVALQGPAEFKVVSDKKGFLEFGNLTAKAPPEARGFAIETPTCTSVDLGTEFGMRVDSTGISETHVFEGEVVLFENDVPVDDLDKGILLTANQASRVVGSVNTAVEIEASPKSFLRLPKQIDSRLVAENVPFDANDDLCLWLDAGKYLNTDESFRVVSWLDLTANGNSKPENAWQVDSEKRPFLIPNAINQRPAVRFMGQEFMVTEPVTTSDNVTMFVVTSMLPQELRKGRFAGIFSSGSPYGLRLFRNRQNHLISKKVGYWKEGKELHTAWNVADMDCTDLPMVVGLVYDKSNNRSELSINGITIREGHAWAPIAMDKSYFIGSLVEGDERYVGDIAEILLFDSAMDSRQVKNVSDWLVEKYSLDSERFVDHTNLAPVSVKNKR